MAAGRFAGLCWGLVAVRVLLVCAEQKNITAKTGQNIILTCIAPNHKTIADVEWSRPDLKEGCVLFYRDRCLDSEQQHALFKNRVDLRDSRMKDRDVSLILKNVTTADTGTYEVRVKPETNRRKRAYLNGDPICTFNLSVDPPGPPGGLKKRGNSGPVSGWSHIWVIVGVCFCVCLPACLFVCLFGIMRYKKQNESKSPLCPPDEAI